MDLTLQKPGDHLFIRAISEAGICIVDAWHKGPLILTPANLIADWTVTGLENLNESSLAPLFDLSADVVLVGTGARQRFLSSEVMMAFYRRNIGVEVMTTRAACVTFNVLALEERRVAAALMPLDS